MNVLCGVWVTQFNSVLLVGNDEGQKVTGLTAILFTAENFRAFQSALLLTFRYQRKRCSLVRGPCSFSLPVQSVLNKYIIESKSFNLILYYNNIVFQLGSRWLSG